MHVATQAAGTHADTQAAGTHASGAKLSKQKAHPSSTSRTSRATAAAPAVLLGGGGASRLAGVRR
eukprot:3200059-Prymnesium_polylepis.1